MSELHVLKKVILKHEKYIVQNSVTPLFSEARQFLLGNNVKMHLFSLGS